MIASLNDIQLSEQKELIHQTLIDYQGHQKRRDDVSVIGFRGRGGMGRVSNQDLVEMDQSLLVHFKPIDDDHRRLFGLVNQLNEAIVKGRNRRAIAAILDELVEYTAWHFRHEDRLMHTNNYPNQLQHKESHDYLVGQVLTIQKNVKENDVDVSTDLLLLLLDWLNVHIHNEDKKLADFLIGIVGDATTQKPPVKDYFVLDNTLLVGVAPIDNDHQKLVNLVNQLHVALEKRHNTGEIMLALERLVDYTAWHFRHEERLMQSNNYPNMADHKVEHQALISQVHKIQNKFKADDAPAPAEMNALIKNWLTNHIHRVDSTFAAFLKAK